MPYAASIAKRATVFARVGSTDQDAAIPIDLNRLAPAERQRPHHYLVPATLQAFYRPRWNTALHHRFLAFEKDAGRIDRRLHVHAVISDITDEMGVTHCLVASAH